MDRLAAMRIFVAVVNARSFSGAAKAMGLANATVTASVKNLERHLGAALLNRNTRHVSVTTAGELYFERVRAVLAEMDAIEAEVSNDTAKGRLVVEVPTAIGRAFIVPHLRRFAAEHPGLQIVMLLNADPGALVKSGIDVGLQLGDLKDSDYIAKKVVDTQHITCAAPAYLDANGRPQHPADLAGHNCLGFFSPRTGRVVDWSYSKGKETFRHTPDGSLHFNSTQALIETAIAGSGVICTLDLLVRDAITRKQLVPLLDGWESQRRPLFLVHPPHRYPPKKVQAFARFIATLWGRAADVSGSLSRLPNKQFSAPPCRTKSDPV